MPILIDPPFVIIGVKTMLVNQTVIGVSPVVSDARVSQPIKSYSTALSFIALNVDLTTNHLLIRNHPGPGKIDTVEIIVENSSTNEVLWVFEWDHKNTESIRIAIPYEIVRMIRTEL